MGRKIWKIRLYNHSQVHQHQLQKASSQTPNNDELFTIATRNAIGQKDARIEDFNAIYAFSRTLLMTALIGGSLVLVKNNNDWRFYAVIVPIIIVLWLRCEQKGYYYAKEVINVNSKLNSL
jgi:hypothetical protein